jgi:hypothetical protein
MVPTAAVELPAIEIATDLSLGVSSSRLKILLGVVHH